MFSDNALVQKMISIKKYNPEYKLYLAGILFAVVSLGGVGFFWLMPFEIFDAVGRCKFLYMTGLYCPGCGGTRAVVSFLHGNIITSFLYHPFVPYCGILYIFYMVRGTLAILSKGKITHMKFRNIYLYIGIGILLLQWVVKDVLIFAGNIYLLGI